MSKGSILDEKSRKLLIQWRADPLDFFEKSRWWGVLECIWAGLPVEELIPFLQSDHVETHAAAMHIVGELGVEARPLLPYAKPYLKSHDGWTRTNAMFCIVTCGSSREFALILEMLLHPCEGTRSQAIRLAIGVGPLVLKGAREWFDPPKRERAKRHLRGIDFVLGNPSDVEIAAMLEDDDLLLRGYAEVAQGLASEVLE